MSRWAVIITTAIMELAGRGTAAALTGSGIQEDPWRIRSLADFDEFAGDANYWDDYTRLETDVNLAGRVYTTALIAPDENNAQRWFQGTKFTGVLDGNDHRIMSLTIYDEGTGNDYLGLFGYIRYGRVSNLGLEGGSVSGNGYYVGGLVGSSEGSLSNCYSTGDVSGSYEIGGLVGSGGGSLSNCYSSGDVSGGQDAGGLVGKIYNGSVSNCYSRGDVSGGQDTGGLVGEIYNGSVSNCYSAGSINGVSSVGGLVGLRSSASILSNCYSTGDVSGEYRVGGLVGNDVIVMKRYSTGDVSGSDIGDCQAAHKAGGISNCYATGDVNGVDYVGGLKGLNRTSVSNCYSTGKVDGTGGHIGGLVGANGYLTTMGCLFGVITDCYWNTETSGEQKMCGTLGSCTSLRCDDSYGRTTVQLYQQATFAGWDFINVWNIGENQTHPYLRTVPAGDINKDRIVNFLDLCIVAEQWMSN